MIIDILEIKHRKNVKAKYITQKVRKCSRKVAIFQKAMNNV